MVPAYDIKANIAPLVGAEDHGTSYYQEVPHRRSTNSGGRN